MPSSLRKPWYRILYVQVLIAVAAGVAFGYFFPAEGKTLKPLGDGFIKLVKMIIAPIIFCTVVHGIASMGNLRKVGRIGGKALLVKKAFQDLSGVKPLTPAGCRCAKDGALRGDSVAPGRLR